MSSGHARFHHASHLLSFPPSAQCRLEHRIILALIIILELVSAVCVDDGAFTTDRKGTTTSWQIRTIYSSINDNHQTRSNRATTDVTNNVPEVTESGTYTTTDCGTSKTKGQVLNSSVEPETTTIGVIEPPFSGFEGSQKIPGRVTHKPPPTSTLPEKYDRRHFGPPKHENLEEMTSPMVTLYFHSPENLPKSPSRDANHRKPSSSGLKNSVEISGYTLEFNDTLDMTTNVNTTVIDELDEMYFFSTDTTTMNNDLEKIEVTILGLFEMSQGTEARPEGPSELQAAKLAIDRINEMGILSRFRLRLVHNDTRVSNAIVSMHLCVLLICQKRIVSCYLMPLTFPMLMPIISRDIIIVKLLMLFRLILVLQINKHTIEKLCSIIYGILF